MQPKRPSVVTLSISDCFRNHHPTLLQQTVEQWTRVTRRVDLTLLNFKFITDFQQTGKPYSVENFDSESGSDLGANHLLVD